MRHLGIWILIIGLLIVRITIFIGSKSSYKDDTKLKISATVWEEPRKSTSSQFIKLYGYNIFLPNYPEINYGDSLVLEGIVKGGELASPRIINLYPGVNPIFKIRKKLISFYRRNLPYPDSVLVSGMVLGSKEGLGQDFWNKMIASGTVHVIVASGMNATLVGGFVFAVSIYFLNRKQALVTTFIFLWLFVLMSGFNPPIIRATIMLSFAFFAQLLGRGAHTTRYLIFAALTMLLVRPDWISDPGFILSIVATYSLVVLSPMINSRICFVPKIVREHLSTTLSAQVATFPIILIYFGRVNVLSVFINTAVLWTIEPLSIISITSGILSFINEYFAKIILYLAYPLTQWFLFVTR